MKLPESWVEARLDVVCQLNPKLGIDERPDDDAEVTFVPMAAVDDKLGAITAPETRTYGDVAKGYTSFKNRDVLLAKVTPCLENGKAAIADSLKNGLGFGSTEFHVLRPTNVVMPEFLFHFIRQPVFRDRAASAFVGTGGLQRVPPDFLARVKFPLPTLHEQQRIVDLLRQAEALSVSRSDTQETISKLTREYYAKLFGDVFSNDKSWSTRKLGQVSEIVRGSSPRPQGDPRLYGGPVPRLMVSDLTRDGLWVDAITDSLTIEGAKSSRPMPAQSVVMAVSGAPGLTAILNHEACIHDGFVGLRNLSADLLPEFVAFTLNLLRVKNDQQAVGAVFRNLTSDQVKAISIPVPPLDLQKQYQQFMFQVRNVQQDMARSTELLEKLSAAVCVDAFTGELTTDWRDQNLKEITAAAQTRDALLRERGAKLAARPPEPTLPSPREEAELSHRHWLLSELSDFQRAVLAGFLAYDGHPLLAEVPDEFDRFRESESLGQHLAAFPSPSPNPLRRTLSQLAALGLIAKVSLPRTNPTTREQEFLTAFRPLRPAEQTRAADVVTLRRSLGLGANPSDEDTPA